MKQAVEKALVRLISAMWNTEAAKKWIYMIDDPNIVFEVTEILRKHKHGITAICIDEVLEQVQKENAVVSK